MPYFTIILIKTAYNPHLATFQLIQSLCVLFSLSSLWLLNQTHHKSSTSNRFTKFQIIHNNLALPSNIIDMGSGAGSFFKVILKNFDVLAGPLVSLVYPLYASVRAIETKSPVDDQQWLTYWILYSMLTLFELTFAKVLEWIPIWPYAKLILSCWLVIPYFSGAAYVYEHFVRPLFINKQTVNIWYVPKMKDIFSKPDDILTAAEKYIAENGTDEFQNLINRADSDRHRPRNRHVSFSNDHEYWQ